MTHARIPDFTPSPAVVRIVPSDPILVAIEAHAEAWAAFQVAPGGEPSERAETALHAALEEMLTTPCASRFGAAALIRHLRWYVREEAVTGDAEDFFGRLVLMREADLALFLGDVTPLVIPTQLPPRGLPPMRRPLALRRAVVKLVPVVGDAVVAIAIIAGGAMLTAYASLL